MAFDAFVQTLWAKCVFCKAKHRGPRNHKASSDEYYFAMVQRQGRTDGWVLCHSTDCARKHLQRLESKEIGCWMCGQHPTHHFAQQSLWIYDMLAETGCKLLTMFCSAECTATYYQRVKMLGGQRICCNCQSTDNKEQRPLRKCAGCGLVYYCSMECQRQHWHKEHKDRCLRHHVKVDTIQTATHVTSGTDTLRADASASESHGP